MCERSGRPDVDPQRGARPQQFIIGNDETEINLDPKILIKYVDTKHQLADMLTKGNFTRDEWNNLLYLFNISHFSSLCCAQNFSLTCCTKTMVKRLQEQKQDNRIVAKSKPTAMNLAVSVSTSSSTVNSPIASKSQGYSKDTVELIGQVQGNLTQEIAITFLDVSTGKLVAPGNSGNSGNSGTEGNDEEWPHNLQISSNYVLHMERSSRS